MAYPQFDTIAISQSQWDKAIEKAIPQVGILFGTIKVLTNKFMPNDKIILINKNEIVGIVNFT